MIQGWDLGPSNLLLVEGSAWEGKAGSEHRGMEELGRGRGAQCARTRGRDSRLLTSSVPCDPSADSPEGKRSCHGAGSLSNARTMRQQPSQRCGALGPFWAF